jgi:hypothetical protein
MTDTAFEYLFGQKEKFLKLRLRTLQQSFQSGRRKGQLNISYTFFKDYR